MNMPFQLSNVTRKYLARYDCILNEMIKGMTEARLMESISHNFIVQMIPHHRAAIAMSENILQYTTDIPLQEIALSIISEQTKSIENMQDILCTCENQINCPQPLCTYGHRVDQILETMFTQMREACYDNQINANFIREMIPHHRGAVRMSRNALLYEICPCLRPILEAIISSQEKGIAQMEALLCHVSR